MLGTGVAEGLCGSAPSVERRGKVERQGKHHEGNGDAGLAIWALCNVVWSRVVEESILKVTSWLSLTLALCVAVQPVIPHIGDGPSDANRSSSSIVDCPSVFAVLDADGFVCMRCASKSCDEKAEVRVRRWPEEEVIPALGHVLRVGLRFSGIASGSRLQGHAPRVGLRLCRFRRMFAGAFACRCLCVTC